MRAWEFIDEVREDPLNRDFEMVIDVKLARTTWKTFQEVKNLTDGFRIPSYELEHEDYADFRHILISNHDAIQKDFSSSHQTLEQHNYLMSFFELWDILQ